jgi:hypothetical protein
MNPERLIPEAPPISDWPKGNVTIIYEDVASGVRAKNFAERIAVHLGGDRYSHSMWRSELLQLPGIAAVAAGLAAESDYLIVSLRGDRILRFAARSWLEAQLNRTELRGQTFVVLSGAGQGRRRVVDGTVHYFQTVCRAKGVAFFSYAAPPVAEEEDGWLADRAQTAERGGSDRGWMAAAVEA